MWVAFLTIAYKKENLVISMNRSEWFDNQAFSQHPDRARLVSTWAEMLFRLHLQWLGDLTEEISLVQFPILQSTFKILSWELNNQ